MSTPDEPRTSRAGQQAVAATQRRPKKRRRWLRRLLLAFTLFSVLAFIGLILLVTVASSIPVPETAKNSQTTIVLFADGRTELGRLVGSENRVEVALSDVPQSMQDAVLAAEDRGFYQHGGVSFPSLARAAYRDLRGGGSRQGGSTISQQYAKNAFNDREKTFARKFREAVIATKLESKYSKNEILELYLNEIYFGRGAYGVEAAARTYYGKSARTLTPEEGAFLAGIIQSPSRYDPDTDKGLIGAERRFRYVLDGLVKTGKYDAAKAATAKFPMPTRPRTATSRIKGPRSFILDAVRAEVRDRLRLEDDDLIYTGGLRIRTSIDVKAQDAAEKAIAEFFKGQPAGLQQGLVSVDPRSGAVRAMYAGRDAPGDRKRIDYSGISGDAKRQPGSSFKPYVLAAALENGIGLTTVYDGDSPSPPYKDKPEGFANFGDQDLGQVDLLKATAKSVNTAYIKLGQDVGIGKVADAAHRAGIRASVKFDETAVSTPLGVEDVPVVDQAVGFATFANGGERVRPYLVGNVFQNKKRLYEVASKKERAFDPKVAADVTFALQAVLGKDGTASKAALDGGRPAAGKTGTTSDNKDTWFVGYTPQLSTAVWVGFDPPQPLKDVQIAGERVTALTGGAGPARVWKRFMDAALAGQPIVAFPAPANIGASASVAPSSASSSAASSSPASSSAPSSLAPSPSVSVELPPALSSAPEPVPTPEPAPSQEPVPEPPPASEPPPPASPPAESPPAPPTEPAPSEPPPAPPAPDPSATAATG